MANGFLRALAKVKLVELDETEEKTASKPSPDPADDPEIQRMIAEAERAQAQQAQQPARKGRPASAPAPAASAAASASAALPPPPSRAREGEKRGEIVENQPFESYYATAGVAAAPYPAEKLLRLLDGLRAMDAPTRKAAVLAMDAADDNWAIADVVLDAQRKLRALVQANEHLKEQVSAIRERARQEKEARDKYLAAAGASIMKKIEELQQTLQKETADVAAQKAQFDAQVAAAESAFQRESARIETEQQRLHEIPTTFVIERPG
jgi:hypothetical protein